MNKKIRAKYKNGKIILLDEINLNEADLLITILNKESQNNKKEKSDFFNYKNLDCFYLMNIVNEIADNEDYSDWK